MRLRGNSPLWLSLDRLLEYLDHPILIETAVPKIRFGVGANL